MQHICQPPWYTFSHLALSWPSNTILAVRRPTRCSALSWSLCPSEAQHTMPLGAFLNDLRLLGTWRPPSIWCPPSLSAPSEPLFDSLLTALRPLSLKHRGHSKPLALLCALLDSLYPSSSDHYVSSWFGRHLLPMRRGPSGQEGHCNQKGAEQSRNAELRGEADHPGLGRSATAVLCGRKGTERPGGRQTSRRLRAAMIGRSEQGTTQPGGSNSKCREWS